MKQRFFLFLSLLALATLLSPGISASATTTPCFQELPDSAWLEGQPEIVKKALNSNLMLYQFEVIPPVKYDFGGVLPIYGDGAFPSGYEQAIAQPKQLINLKYGVRADSISSKIELTLENAESLFDMKLVDVKVGARDRDLRVNVRYTYSGTECADRKVLVARSLKISSIPTYDLTATSDVQLQGILDETDAYSNIGDIKSDIMSINYIKIWMANTKTNPMKVVLPKGYTFPKSSYILNRQALLNSVEGYSQLFRFTHEWDLTYFDSVDGCLTNSRGEKNVHLLYSEPFLNKSGSVCPVYFHLFVPMESQRGLYSDTSSSGGPPSMQFVVKGWVTGVKDFGKISKFSYNSGIYCFNGKVFKLAPRDTGKCPTGFSPINY